MYIYMSHLYSSVDRHLLCFYMLATVNRAPMNIGVHVSFLFFFLIYLTALDLSCGTWGLVP